MKMGGKEEEHGVKEEKMLFLRLLWALARGAPRRGIPQIISVQKTLHREIGESVGEFLRMHYMYWKLKKST